MTTVPPVKDFMTKNPLTVDLFDSASSAEKLMSAKGIHHLPVMDGKKVYSIICDRDITIARRSYERGLFDGKVLVKDICFSEPLTFKEDTPLNEVARKMIRKKQDAAIIVRDNTVRGIFTTTDACKFISEIFESASAKKGLFAKIFG
jgi:CBS domain-containing protein